MILKRYLKIIKEGYKLMNLAEIKNRKVNVVAKNKSAYPRYKRWLFSFAIVFFIIISSTLITGKKLPYEHSIVGTRQYLARDIPIEILDTKYNPTNGLLRLDLRVEQNNKTERVTNIEIKEMHSAYIDDPSKELQTELLRVSPYYYVMHIHPLPEDFTVVGVGLQPSYIEPDIETTDKEAMEKRRIQYYFYSDVVERDNDLLVKELDSYKIDWINFREDEIKNQISELEEQVRLSRVIEENCYKAIDELDVDTQFFTEEEEKELEKEISKLENSIVIENNTLKAYEEDIAILKDRLDLYEKEKEEIKG